MNSKKSIGYLELAVATAFVTILYLVLRHFQISELLPIDGGKTMDVFIAQLLEPGMSTDQGFLAFCQYNVQNMIIYLFCSITGNVIVGINSYYVMTFFAISFSAYWLLKKVGVSQAVSVFGAVLLTVLPYHTDRGAMQIITSSFFMVPIIIGIFYDIYFLEREPKAERKYTAILLVLPWIDLNLSFMTVILMVMLCLQRHIKEKTFLTVVYGIPMLMEAFVIYALTHWGNQTSPAEAVERAKEEGLRIFDLIMPVRRHIYDRFFNLRYDYDVSFSANGESGFNTLGVLLVMSFVTGLLVLLFCKKGNLFVRWLSWMNIIIILFANIGGFGLLVEYIGIHVTYWNRMGIFVIVSSTVILGIYADQIKDWVQKKHSKVICNIAFVCVAVIAVLDVLLRHA